tara:strand:+ start:7066 stop:7341 length:276 start_codon:yes stop_codon:yes gene_type:complete
MLKFKAANLEELQEEMNLRSLEVSTVILEALCNALDNEVDYVEIGIIKGGLSIGVSRPDFLKTFNTNFDRVQEAENYELCARSAEWMGKIS